MPISLNVYFETTHKYLENARGKHILAALEPYLFKSGCETGRIERYMDQHESEQLGWKMKVVKEEQNIMIYETPWSLDWIPNQRGLLLTIAPSDIPGFFRKLISDEKPSATPESIFLISTLVHDFLKQSRHKEIYWKWDGDPDRSSDYEPPSPT